jgi:hypothetical protein
MKLYVLWNYNKKTGSDAEEFNVAVYITNQGVLSIVNADGLKLFQ